MNKLKGKITSIKVKTGSSAKGDWASVEFEVVESHPMNVEYPQIGLFDMFKNGEHIKYATEFENSYPVGTEVDVDFILKKNEYTDKEGNERAFYKTACWGVKLATKEAEPTAAQMGDDSDGNAKPY